MIGTIGTGIKIGRLSPTFGYRDVIGQMYPDTGGVDAPSLEIWRGVNRRFSYGVGDRFDTEIHNPHDLIRSDIFNHFHWGHNGTAISGNLEVDIHFDHTKGHRQVGGSNIVHSIVIPANNLQQYSSDITDHLLAEVGGSGLLFDSTTFEPDDSVNIAVIVTAIPTITGGLSNSPFIWNADLHAQTSGVLGTKNKSSNFYT